MYQLPTGCMHSHKIWIIPIPTLMDVITVNNNWYGGFKSVSSGAVPGKLRIIIVPCRDLARVAPSIPKNYPISK